MKSYWQWLLPLALIPGQNTWSEIVTDGSLNGNVHAVAGPQYNIAPDLGKTVGNNLFHSFSQFNINQGETANFQAATGTANIFTRVTGGTSSHIDGTLNSSSAASLWLINPAGWVIGKDAAINVNGALHFTSANAIGFSDGGLFLADPVSKSTLTAAAPVDYQFTQSKQGTITIDETDIVLEPGKNISLVGGDISLQNSHIQTKGGRIMLGSNAGNGLWQENLNGLTQQSGGRGNINIIHTSANGSSLRKPSLTTNETTAISIAKLGGGEIQLMGEQINLQNATLTALAVGDAKGGPISLDGKNMILNASSINTSTVNNNNAGPIAFRGDNLTLTGAGQIGSHIQTDSDSGGESGHITIDLNGALKMDRGSEISSAVTGTGNGADINIHSDKMLIDQNSLVSVNTYLSGNAGKINIQSQHLTLDNNSRIDSSTNGDRRNPVSSTGNAGDISIASNDMSIQHLSAITSSSTKASKGEAGDIGISGIDPSTYNTLYLHQSRINTSLLGSKGDGGNITVNAGILALNGGTIQANTEAVEGHGGAVTVTAQKTLYSGDQVLIGGNEVHNFDKGEYNFNVIQAAARAGTNGQVTVSPVSLFLSGQLAKVDAIFVNNKAIANDPCSVSRGAETSSLVQLGNGGLPPNASDAISLPVQRYLQSDQAMQTSAIEPAMQIALYTPSHLCSQDNS